VRGRCRGRRMAVKRCQNGSTASHYGARLLVGLLVCGVGAAALAGTRPLVVGEIEYLSDDIFTPQEVAEATGASLFLRQTMNQLHVNTRRYVVARELLFATGDVYRPAQLAETERNLRQLGYLNDVEVAAVDTTDDGRVHIVVRTRDAWTLQTALSFSRSSQGESRWSARVSDGNFMGHGVTIGAGVGGDEITSYWNTWYRQRRLLKAGFQLAVDYSRRRDGYQRQLVFNRPFYALDDGWGTEFRVWSREFGQRFYLSNGGAAGLDAANPNRLYALLTYHEKGVEVRARWRQSTVGSGRVWRLGGGLDVVQRGFRQDLSLVDLSDGRQEDLTWLQVPGQAYAREDGVEVNPFVWVRTLGRRWAKRRYVLQYGTVEDIPLEWDVDLKLGPVGGAVGSTSGYGESRWMVRGKFRCWFEVGDGLAVLDATGSAVTGGALVRNYRYDGTLGWLGQSGPEMTPWLTRVFVEYAQAENLLGSEALVLGLNRGLRTLGFDGMAGDHLMRWNLEQGKATAWEPGGLVRMGLAAFYSGGSAW